MIINVNSGNQHYTTTIVTVNRCPKRIYFQGDSGVSYHVFVTGIAYRTRRQNKNKRSESFDVFPVKKSEHGVAMNYLSGILGITRRDRKRSDIIRKVLGVNSTITRIEKQQFK